MEGEGEGCERGQLQAVPRVIARRGQVCGSPDAVMSLSAGAARLAGLMSARAVPLPAAVAAAGAAAAQLRRWRAALLTPDDAEAADARRRPLAHKSRLAGVTPALVSVQG